MRRLIAITQVTLDGVMQSPGGPEEDPRNGFTHGGWVMPFWDEALGQAIGETIAGEFDMLLGRRTYEIFAAYWPKQGDNPIAKAFNRAEKYVVTRTIDQLDWKNSRHIRGDVVDEVRRLKASDGPVLHIWGSGELLRALIAADLVDEYRIWVFPLVLGEGTRLFENGVPPGGLALVETRRTPKGVLINTYRPAGSRPPVADPRHRVAGPGRGVFRTGWALTGFVGLFLLVDGGARLAGFAPYVEGLTKFGYAASLGPWIGLALLVSTILMLIPRTAALGCILVTGYLGGATATQVRVQDAWFLFPILLGAMSWLGLYLREPRLRGLLPFRV